MPPKWTVLYNIVSPETGCEGPGNYVGTGWEFFTNEADADKCLARHKKLGNCAMKRPFHKNDIAHMGAVHRHNNW